MASRRRRLSFECSWLGIEALGRVDADGENDQILFVLFFLTAKLITR